MWKGDTMLFGPLIKLNNFLYKKNLEIFIALNNWAIRSLNLPVRPKLSKKEMQRLKEVLKLKTVSKKVYEVEIVEEW